MEKNKMDNENTAKIRGSIMHKEILEEPGALRHTFDINEEPIKEIASLLKKEEIDHCVLVARGSSDNACVYFKYLFEKYMQIPCSFSVPSVTTVYGTKLIYKHCLVIGVSQSGMGEDVAEVMRNANDCGAFTIGITNDPASLLAKISKRVLLLDCGDEKSVAATKTFLTELLVLAQLVLELSNDDGLRQDLLSTSELVSKVIDNESNIEAMAHLYKAIDDCYFLSRGFCYAGAMESALKLQETTYARGKAYSLAEFYHGPFAVIGPRQDVVMLHGEGKMDDEAKAMLDRLLDSGCKPLIVTNDKEFASYPIKIDIPSCQETVAIFPLVATIQLFVNAIAIERGNNPDAPRGLKKVTITK